MPNKKNEKLKTTTRIVIQSRFFHHWRYIIGFVAVLTRDDKWKCFMGTCPRHNDEQFNCNYIADLGIRVPKDIAVATFPMIKKEYKY